ncbi:hemolysin activation/secretion protein [Paraburkholderia fungorum]|uniref:hypothetical protein n=1 Tax=Paraburkholderia fungorum TaxID=134537 RepID=UPI000D079502|nr:hypothetical protein [Paraburkholderia fungorum]PRZ56385.1 hemolysin activation/secretion protein [Paraburkholderia fungorum]
MISPRLNTRGTRSGSSPRSTPSAHSRVGHKTLTPTLAACAASLAFLMISSAACAQDADLTAAAQSSPAASASADPLGDYIQAHVDQSPRAPLNAGEATVETKVWGWTVRSNNLGLLDAATINLDEDAMRTQGVDAQKGETIAAFLQARLMKAGYASIVSVVHPDERVIEIGWRNVAVEASGPHNYFRLFSRDDGHPLSRNDLEAQVRLAQDAASINGDAVAVTLSNPMSASEEIASGQEPSEAGHDRDAVDMPLSIQSTRATDSKTYGGALAFSTYGQRYSGKNVFTASAYASPADAVQVDVSASKAATGLSDDSRGGNFDNVSVGSRYITPQGVASLRFTQTYYKQGGELFTPFGVGGNIARVDGQWEKYLNSRLSLVGGVSLVTQKQFIDAAGLTDRQNLAFAQFGVNYQEPGLAASVRVLQGLAGSDNYNYAPLAGLFNPHFTALTFDGQKSIPLREKWWVDLTMKAQVGSRDTPSVAGIYGGGPGGGRYYTTGNIAGPDGLAGSSTLNYAVSPLATLYAGVDGAVIKPAVGDTQTQASVFAGVKTGHAIPIAHTKVSFAGDLGLSVGAKAPQGEKRGVAVGFFGTFAY